LSLRPWRQGPRGGPAQPMTGSDVKRVVERLSDDE
jgi:hypothetical protein